MVQTEFSSEHKITCESKIWMKTLVLEITVNTNLDQMKFIGGG